MIGSVRSELRKVFSTRLWWVLGLVAFAYTGLTESLLAWAITLPGGMESDSGFMVPTGPDLALLVYSAGASFGYVFPVLFGALLVTTEYRYQTITPTLLADPNRLRLLGGKLIAVLPLSLGFGLVVLVASVVCGGGVLALTGQDAGLTTGDVWQYLLRCVLAMTVWGLVGVGLGALFKHQVVAIVALLGFTQFLEPMLRMIPLFTGREFAVLSYLPGAVGDAITGTSMYDAILGGGAHTIGLLPALVALFGYAALCCVAGYFTTLRRDVS